MLPSQRSWEGSINPTLDQTRVVDPRVVTNNEKLSSATPEIKDQAVQKPDEVIGIDSLALQEKERSTFPGY